jgi:hypothetical protein
VFGRKLYSGDQTKYSGFIRCKMVNLPVLNVSTVKTLRVEYSHRCLDRSAVNDFEREIRGRGLSGNTVFLIWVKKKKRTGQIEELTMMLALNCHKCPC